MTYSTKYIDKTVHVTVDRKINTKHPKFENTVYNCNYGFVPNTKAPDGEEIDAYVLGVSEPIENFTGKCIAVIHRTNDDDDKLVVVPEGKNFTDKEIKELTPFQEKYFESMIIRES